MQCQKLTYISAIITKFDDHFNSMIKQMIIERTWNASNHFPEDKAEEISDFAGFVCKRYEEQELTKGIEKLTSEGHTFEFLNTEAALYSIAGLKEVYNG
jgi:hypothetical protein